MSMRYQAAVLTASYFPLKAPDAPTIGVAVPLNGTSIQVAFTAPSNVGDGAITSYTVVATDSVSGETYSDTGSSSPLAVSGLTNGNAYTLKVSAVNEYGRGPLSAASNSVSLTLVYYTTPGSYTFVVPTGVTALSAAAIGGGGGAYGGSGSAGGGGGGGTFRYVNSISVTPAASYTVTVGVAGTKGLSTTDGGESSFGSLVVAPGGLRSSGSSGGVGGSGGTGSGGNGGTGGVSGGSYGAFVQGGGGGGGAGGRNGGGGGGTGADLGNAPYDQTRNGSYSGGAGGFGGGGNGGVGGGVFFQTTSIGSTTAYSQGNMPFNVSGFTYYGGGGGGAYGQSPAVPRDALGGAVAVVWDGGTF